MTSPERFQNIVLAAERPAMPMKNLSINTEEGRGIFPLRSEIAGSSIGDYDEPPDIDRGCRCWRCPSLAQSSRQRPDVAKDDECLLRTRTVRRRLLLVEGHLPPSAE